MQGQQGQPIRRSSIRDSFLYPQRQPNPCLRFFKKFDFFSFIPVPKDEPISTKRSIIGSCIFLVLILAYIIVDFYQFLVENPPIVQNSQSTIDDKFYKMPKVAITFMQGQSLNQTKNYDKYFNYVMTKQLKDNSIKLSTPIQLIQNNKTYMQDWLGNNTLNFYNILYTPNQQMYGKGLLYSTQNCNYTKIMISLCNLNNKDNNCENYQNISSLLAKGRIFLFIQDQQDQSGISQERSRPNKFRIGNFFLMPKVYKRITVQFQVRKTTILPDYFFHFKQRTYQRLQLYSINQQVSNTSINDQQRKQQSLQLLGINFQLAAEVLNVRVTYVTLLDHVAKWGAFFNVLFAVFAIIFLAYNRQRFYQKNPDWNRFKKKISEGNTIITSGTIDFSQKLH